MDRTAGLLKETASQIWVMHEEVYALQQLLNPFSFPKMPTIPSITSFPSYIPTTPVEQGSAHETSGGARPSTPVKEIPKEVHRTILAGDGPRTSTQVIQYANLLFQHEAYVDLVQKHGGRFKESEILVVGRNPENYVGRGNAFGPNQGGGTVNTGAEKAGIDYEPRLKAHYNSARREQLVAQWTKDSPVAAAQLRAAYDGTEGKKGELVTHRGIATRQEQGEEEYQHFAMQKQRVEQHFPFVKIHVLSETEAAKLDMSDPKRPAVTLRQAKSRGFLAKVQANEVRLNTGTTVTSPIKDPEAAPYTFAEAMDPKALNDFMDRRGLKAEDGMLDPAKRVASGGSGLSQYDQLIGLHLFMNLFLLNEKGEHNFGQLFDPIEKHNEVIGYRLTESAKEKYKGAITIISNTPGKWVPPRHSHGVLWTSPEKPFGTAAHLHALTLHQDGQEVFKAWKEIAQASIAIASGRTPAELGRPGLTTEQLLAEYHESTMQHTAKLYAEQAVREGGERDEEVLGNKLQTEEEASRNAYLSTITGLGLPTDIAKTVETMSEIAAFTFKGREGYPMHRYQAAAISDPSGAAAADNAKLFSVLGNYMAHVTSSPFRVHEMAHMLMEAGIVTYMPGSYEKIKKAGVDRPLAFTSKSGEKAEFDAFIVSPTFDRAAEDLLNSMAGQITPVDPALPTIPKLGEHRRVMTASGKLSNVLDNSLNGKGAPIPGTRRMYGQNALDTNNKESATQISFGVAYRQLSLEFLMAGSVPNAEALLDELYAQFKPTDEKFNKETNVFKPFFKEAVDAGAYLAAAREAAGKDRPLYYTLATSGRTPKERTEASRIYGDMKQSTASGARDSARKFLKLHSRDGNVDNQTLAKFGEVMEKYDNARRTLPEYDPVSNETFHRRAVDVPDHVHETVFKLAVRAALEQLGAHNAVAEELQVTSRESDDHLFDDNEQFDNVVAQVDATTRAMADHLFDSDEDTAVETDNEGRYNFNAY